MPRMLPALAYALQMRLPDDSSHALPCGGALSCAAHAVCQGSVPVQQHDPGHCAGWAAVDGRLTSEQLAHVQRGLPAQWDGVSPEALRCVAGCRCKWGSRGQCLRVCEHAPVQAVLLSRRCKWGPHEAWQDEAAALGKGCQIQASRSLQGTVTRLSGAHLGAQGGSCCRVGSSSNAAVVMGTCLCASSQCFVRAKLQHYSFALPRYSVLTWVPKAASSCCRVGW